MLTDALDWLVSLAKWQQYLVILGGSVTVGVVAGYAQGLVMLRPIKRYKVDSAG